MKRTIISLFSLLPLTFAACGGSDSGDCTASGGTNKGQFVVNSVLVPSMSAKDYAIDLNGDTKLDNQLGQIILTLAGQGLNVQDGVNQALTGGDLVLLVQESSTDASFSSDSCASTTLQLGQKVATPPPDFSGMGTFTPDGTQTPSTFNGPITGGKFNSAPPSTTTHPVTASVTLPLVAGQTPVPIVLQGAHLQFTHSASGLMNGELQGAIKSSDVQANIIPAVASLLSNKLKNDMPPTSTDSQISSLFDTGGSKADPSCTAMTCKNPTTGMDPLGRAGMCAAKGDGIIDVCEVSTNSLVQNLLSPDVQLFDATGAYKPNKENTMRDSLSVGLGFTAVGAKF